MRAIIVGSVLIVSTVARAEECDVNDAAGGSWTTLIATEFDKCIADPQACNADVPSRRVTGAFATGEATVAGVGEARTGADPVAGGEVDASGRAGWHSIFQACGHTSTVAAKDGRGDWGIGLAWPHGFAPLGISFERQWEQRPALDASRVWLARTYGVDELDTSYAIAGWRTVDGAYRAALPFRLSVSRDTQDHTRAVLESWWFALYSGQAADGAHIAVAPVSIETMYANGTGTDARPIPPTSWLAQIDGIDLVHRFGDVAVELAGGYLTTSVPLHDVPVAARARVATGPWSLRAERSAHLAMDQVIAIEDRLAADYRDGRWHASAFIADTRTTSAPERELTGGGSAGVDFKLPDKLQLALDVGVARSYYARLDSDSVPAPELAGTGSVRLERHFDYNPTAH